MQGFSLRNKFRLAPLIVDIVARGHTAALKDHAAMLRAILVDCVTLALERPAED